MTEMQKLESVLTTLRIPFDKVNIRETDCIKYPCQEMCICSVVCHKHSYGGNEGLLEIMGLAKNYDDDTEGYLYAADVADRIIRNFFKLA